MDEMSLFIGIAGVLFTTYFVVRLIIDTIREKQRAEFRVEEPTE